MIAHDAALPPGFRPPIVDTVERHGVFYAAARWTPDALHSLAGHLAAAAPPSPERLRHAWKETVSAFRDVESGERQALDESLKRFSGLSRQGVEAALEAVLGGLSGAAANRLFDQALELRGGGLVAVFLASNLPGLAAQPLLPALALGRPTLLKSPSSEPLFAPAFVRALARREPALAGCVAAVAWPGGDAALEAPILDAAGVVLVYGEQQTLDDLARRAAPEKLRPFGPKLSIALLTDDCAPAHVAEGLARDVALFDQRGCLSIQAVFTTLPAVEVANVLADALRRAAERWPPGPLDPTAVARVQQLRIEGRLRGLYQPPLAVAEGTVLVDSPNRFAPGPGLRTVQVLPLGHPAELPPLLAPWKGRLQGAALCGAAAWDLAPALRDVGVSRCAAPGSLQGPDALWHNGGEHPLALLAGRDRLDGGGDFAQS